MPKLYNTLWDFWNSVEFDDTELVTPIKVFDNDGNFIGYKKEYI